MIARSADAEDWPRDMYLSGTVGREDVELRGIIDDRRFHRKLHTDLD